MDPVEKLTDLAHSFVFEKGDYEGVKVQFLKFTENYSKLNIEEADRLRDSFDAKIRLGWFGVSTRLFLHSIIDANATQKDELCMILFAFYSFDNLDFGYDSLLDLARVSNALNANNAIAKKNWPIFKKLTSRKIAIDNLESNVFGKP